MVGKFQTPLQLGSNKATVARWPNFRPNNSKEAPKNCPWLEKIGGWKMAEYGKKWQKRLENIFTIIEMKNHTINCNFLDFSDLYFAIKSVRKSFFT
jgi:hypothetical protein